MSMLRLLNMASRLPVVWLEARHEWPGWIAQVFKACDSAACRLFRARPTETRLGTRGPAEGRMLTAGGVRRRSAFLPRVGRGRGVGVAVSHVYGPVPSRRLGRSLGIDLVPFKTCTYDCIYCQLGRTTRKTVARNVWVPLDDVISDLEAKLSRQPDYITLGGSGEPTLHTQIGELIERIKSLTSIPVAVLTNGSLLYKREVRRALGAADLIIPSLDAGDEMQFRHINRPHKAILFDQMLEGLIACRNEVRAQYWLEVLLLAGCTETNDQIARLIQWVDLIRPERVHLNTVTRPPAEDFALGVSRSRMAELAALFHPPAEVVADYSDIHQQAEFPVSRDEIVSMLRRRPCSISDIAGGLGMHRNEVIKHVEELDDEGLLRSFHTGRGRYYRAAEPCQAGDRCPVASADGADAVE